MSAQKTERLLNLVICLLSTRQFLAKEQIRSAVPQYAGCTTDEAFDRMFERDKDELRDMGVPLETGANDAWFVDDVGYRVDRAAYALPEVRFEPDELAVLGLASRVWQQASLAAPASRALLKLTAQGIDSESAGLVGIEPRVRTSEPAFDRVYAAVRDRQAIRFPYRTPGNEAPSLRHLEPWGIVSRHGRWYVVGHDRDREATRVFRLSRVAGTVEPIGAPGDVVVPDGVDFRGPRSPLWCRCGPRGRQSSSPARVLAWRCGAAPDPSARGRPGGTSCGCPTATPTSSPRRSAASVPTCGSWRPWRCGRASYAGWRPSSRGAPWPTTPPGRQSMAR